MTENKLIGILKTLSLGEMKGFDRFLSSGLMHVSEPVHKLFTYLASLYPVFYSAKLEKKIVFNSCFVNQKYDDKKLRYLLTELTRCCDSYISFISLQKQGGLKHNILAKEYAERNCEKAYLAIVHSSRNKEKTSLLRDASFYYSRYDTEYIQMEYAVLHSQRKENSNVDLVTTNLDKFYLIKKLQLCCEIQNVKNVMSKEHRILLLDEIIEHISKYDYEDSPGIAIYYLILMTLKDSENEIHFKKLQQLLLKHAKVFEQNELRDMYQYVLNYCIKKINTGNVNYQRIIFESYKVILANGIILVKNRLSQWDYKNIITISLRLGELSWCYKFIHNYIKHISPKERENALNYNIAYWHYYKKEYSQTLHFLQRVNFTDLYYQLDSRVIILKIYVDQNEDEALFYHISAFRIFLNRNKLISNYQRTTYKNLIKYTARMVRASGNKKKIAELKKEIMKNKQVADLQWLNNKMNEQ